jgi:hypothetical protein
MESWKHFRAVLLLTFIVTVVIPVTLLSLTEADTFDLRQSYP